MPPLCDPKSRELTYCRPQCLVNVRNGCKFGLLTIRREVAGISGVAVLSDSDNVERALIDVTMTAVSRENLGR